MLERRFLGGQISWITSRLKSVIWLFWLRSSAGFSKFDLLWDVVGGFQCTTQVSAVWILELSFHVMIDGMGPDWDDPGAEGRNSGEKQTRAYLRAPQKVGLTFDGGQRFPVLATE